MRKHCVPSWAPACPAVGAKEDLQLHQKQQDGHRLLGHRLLLRQRRAVRYPHVTLCRSRLSRLWGNCFKGCYCPSSSSHPCHPRRFHRNHCFRWPSIRKTWAVRSCMRTGSRTRRSGYSSTLARHASERCKNGWIGSPPCTPPRRPASPCHPFHPQVRMKTQSRGQGTPGWPLVACRRSASPHGTNVISFLSSTKRRRNPRLQLTKRQAPRPRPPCPLLRPWLLPLMHCLLGGAR